MVKSSRSVSLETQIWLEIDKYRIKKGISDISSAVEELVKKGLKSDKNK